ncbi:phosphotransferase enzyme family protein [Hypoxylon sp. NC1633]|nr:phosphotransferase enzyme family protein [Hypoxylon sp. NC1633]
MLFTLYLPLCSPALIRTYKWPMLLARYRHLFTSLLPLCLLGFVLLVMRHARPTNAIEPERVAAVMLSWHSLELVSCKKLQTLWAGYGYIYELTARATSDEVAAQLRKAYRLDTDMVGRATETFPLILKFVAPPPGEDEGHLRKLMSYEVEQYFYNSIAPHLENETAVAHCVATTRDSGGKPDAELLDGLTATLMTDLRHVYPIAGEKRSELDRFQVYGALDWLSSFHRTSRKLIPGDLHDFLLPPLEEAQRKKNGDKSGTKLWLNGGYTYLATRRKEYAALAEDEDSEWSAAFCAPVNSRGQSISEMAANFLAPRGRDYETLIHGDVKSENLFTTKSGGEVAFYDFQYVGIGLGVCDLAKLFTCSVPMNLLIGYAGRVPNELPMDDGEKRLLEYYYAKLLEGFEDPEGRALAYDWDAFVRHWETALVDWLRFQASWGFWGNTEWLEARVRSILQDEEWRKWLGENQK